MANTSHVLRSQFFAQLDKFCDVTVPEKYNEMIRNVAMALVRALISHSPVDTGRFRCSWVAGKNSANTDIPTFTSDDGGSASISRVMAALSGMKYGDSLYISSNLAYSLMLEYGWSGQAPSGVAEISVMEVSNMFSRSRAG